MNSFKMLLIRTAILLFFFNSNNLMASEYLCPQTPLYIKAGDYVQKDWFIWPELEKRSSINKYYYKFFGEKYKIGYWAAFSSGERSNIKKDNMKYFISCCILIKSNNKLYCAYKNVSEKNCKPNIRGPGPDKFTCEKPNIS